MNSRILAHPSSLQILNRIATGSCLQPLGSVRWKRREPKRKPVWLPRAPSKIFIIKEKVILPKDEEEQIEHLHWMYQSQLLSIQNYCMDNFYLPAKQSGGLSAEQVQEEEEEQAKLLQENQRENERVAERREERLLRERSMFEEDLLRAEEEKKALEDALRLEAESVVQREVERSSTYITKETLEACIEEALANPVHYDFAIEKDGTIVTDGTIHVHAATPTALPDSSSTAKSGMTEAKNDLRLKAKKIYYDPLSM